MDAQDLNRAPALVRTARLELHAPRPELAAPFVESLLASRDTLGFIAWGRAATDPEFGARFLQYDVEAVARGEYLVYYAFVAAPGHAGLAEGAYVGRIDLHSWDWEAPRCEVGYVGDARAGGRGLMREAVLAAVDVAFALGAARVQALSEADNARALHFAEHALGFTREGRLRNYERDAHGRLGEQVMFAAYNPAAS